MGFSERRRVLLVPINQVIYLRAELKYITVRTAVREYLLEESLTHLEQEFGNIFVRLHRNCLVANAYILGYEKRSIEGRSDNQVEACDEPIETGDKQWFALLKDIPETIAVSRRQQHIVRKT